MTYFDPPGPPGYLLVGNLPAFGRDALGFLTACARDFGDIAGFRLGRWPAFRPERWLDQTADRLPRFAYFPLGGGPRPGVGCRREVGCVSGLPDVRCTMRISHFTFGAIDIDGVTYEHDVVIDRGEIHQRKKKASKKFRETFGHTPLSVEENIPWKCTRLVIGTGAYGRLPVMDEVKRQAEERGVQLVVLPTAEAIKVLHTGPQKTNAILHVTC